MIKQIFESTDSTIGTNRRAWKSLKAKGNHNKEQRATLNTNSNIEQNSLAVKLCMKTNLSLPKP